MSKTTKTIFIELDQNGIKENREIKTDFLKTAGDILKELKINEETVLLFFKNEPIPFDEPISGFDLSDGEFRILKVTFDE
jgi:hypothetical protein